MKRKILFTALVVFISISIKAQKDDRVLVVNKTNLKIYVHTKSIVKEDEYVTFWTEHEYLTQKERNEIINNQVNYIKEYEKYKEIDYVKWGFFKSVKRQLCIDISDNTMSSIQQVYYTSDGKVLYTRKYENFMWDDVVPGTLGSEVYDYVKNYVKNRKQITP